MSVKAHLEEDEKVVKFAFERTSIETRSASIEKGTDETNSEAVVETVNRRGDVRPRSTLS